MQVSMKKIAEIVGCTPQAVSSVFKNNSTTKTTASVEYTNNIIFLCTLGCHINIVESYCTTIIKVEYTCTYA